GGRIGGWEPLSKLTYELPRRKKLGGHGTLNVRGTLLTSASAKARWTVQGQTGSLFVAKDTFRRSNAIYGHLQHEGGMSPLTGGDIPDRPFFVFNQEDEEKAAEVILKWISDNFDKRIGLKASGKTVGSI
ncbi:MAG: hypothetical protein LC687_03460, partial [Actinobacteria bacterium]|nr:hypothetical protein [Actinomycetota bacterium]